jgi:hypothetical protein
VTAAYTHEFNQMWGSTTNVPDPGESRMGSAKFFSPQTSFEVNGIPVGVRFAPADGWQNVMINTIGQTGEHAIYFSILAFTREDIEGTLRTKWDLIPGFEIRGVFDRNYDPNSRYPQMSGQAAPPWVPPADVHLGNYSPGFLHHKTMLIDPGHPQSDPIVITGSANWSTAAGSVNDENQVYIHDYSIARQYLQEFAERYHAAGGSGPLGVGSGIADQAAPLGRNRLGLVAAPNPFAHSTEIGFDLPAGGPARLRIFDAGGRMVRELHLGGRLSAGTHHRTWDGRDAAGSKVPGGIYFFRLDTAGQAVSQPLTLVR